MASREFSLADAQSQYTFSAVITDERIVGVALALVHEHQRASERRSILSRPQPKMGRRLSRFQRFTISHRAGGNGQVQ